MRGRSRRVRAALVALVAVTGALVWLGAVPAVADFRDPGTNPADSPRVDTPNDPDFDRCEADDEETGLDPCGTYFEEQFGAFGFSPDSALSAPGVRTRYNDCSQLDEQGREANRDAETDPDALAECYQLAGVRADTAWKYSTGSPSTTVAILDTGIEWQTEELVEKVALNGGELPTPDVDPGRDPRLGDQPCSEFDAGGNDANDDGGFNVRDFACTPGVGRSDGDEEADDILDPSDLIAEFSNDSDQDQNGYVDDIAGWDFFDDDNDPFDASSCCSASGHGTGRALEAARQTDDARGEAGMCPDCQVLPLRVWDSFVVDTNMFALGTVYATDNGADVVEGAVGGLLNSQFARRAFTYADEKGVTLTLVSSDINSANHNYPTNYNEAIYVGGSLPDSAPLDCGIPDAPGGFTPSGPDDPFFGSACFTFFDFLSDRSGGVTPPGTQPPTTSFFRNSNLTQYGGKADVVLMGATGSENTGQASGAAGLLASYGRRKLDTPLSGNEIRQLLTMTAEDVLPENTGIIGTPDRAEDGWDTHFGYGRVNVAGAMERIQENRIPPEAQLDAPDWFAPINVDRVGADGVAIEGRVAAPHGQVGQWELEYACGQDALDSDFEANAPIATGSGPVDGELGTLSKATLEQLADSCDGQVQNDAGRPAGRDSDPWPADPYPDPDPERHAFQVRLTVHEQGDEDNVGRYRKTLHAYNDDGNLPGYPKPIGSGSEPDKLVTGSGGETPPRLADLDGDDRLDVLLGTSSGELHALDQDGDPLASFNGGQPVTTEEYAQAASHDRPATSLSGDPREPVRTPAIGDLDGDGEPELVATAGERIYAWHRDGDPVDGFPARIDPDLSEPCAGGADAKPCFDAADRVINRQNHIKRGFFGSPALADLDEDGRLDIVAGALDQHVYAFDRNGDPLSGFPAKLEDDRAQAGAEIITSPAIADLDGDDDPEVVIATNEVLDGEFDIPDVATGLMDAIVRGGTGANVVYALEGDGTSVGGEWPAEIGTLAGDILPLVVPGNDAAAVDVDGDGDDEVAISAATGDAKLVDGDGSDRQVFSNDGTGSPNVTDESMQLNLADYPSVGELTEGSGPSVIKGGISLNGVANLLAVNQNLPFNHVVQAWNPQSGTYLPGYPTATDDFVLVSQPAVAKVGGSAPERQALAGTGLYQLHAYGPTGLDAPGWPKFLGGWVQPTPASGDVDGDGKLEVAAVTREGWSFLWKTDADACQEGSTTTNQEWWTFHHDEFSTANYGTDARPPSRPGDLDLESAGEDLALSFLASGDDLECGAPERYEARGSDEPIDSGADFEAAEELDAEAAALSSGGDPQELTVKDGARFRFVAIRAVDDAGNVSYVRSAQTPKLRRCKGEVATIVGTTGDDELRGEDGRDVIVSRAGDDEVRGRDGGDLVCAGKGADSVDAGKGKDVVTGAAGDDDLEGGDGSDRLKGGTGDDELRGQDGDDTLDGNAGDDLLKGGSGDDELGGDEGADRLRGGGGDDTVRGGSGTDDVED